MAVSVPQWEYAELSPLRYSWGGDIKQDDLHVWFSCPQPVFFSRVRAHARKESTEKDVFFDGRKFRVETILGDLGLWGWELVSVLPGLEYHFKRLAGQLPHPEQVTP